MLIWRKPFKNLNSSTVMRIVCVQHCIHWCSLLPYLILRSSLQRGDSLTRSPRLTIDARRRGEDADREARRPMPSAVARSLTLRSALATSAGLRGLRPRRNVTSGYAVRYQFDAAGKVLHSSGGGWNPYQYTGEPCDDSGLTYLRARYYNPGIGRFVRPTRSPASRGARRACTKPAEGA
ncbi:MAG: hypothetical protein EXR52_04575 [Dehalococcoidia bacterium]|nr:hypothetical protein [Dehalococcoidia bacterium]